MTGLLLPQHQQLITDSAISSQVAAERNYRSATDPAELRSLGFADYQCMTPSLLIPVQDAFGQNGYFQSRPDHPRVSEAGKPIKYESIAGSRLILDVPQRVRPLLEDPMVPLWITEGSRKVDAAVSRGLCCIGLMGVWGWRGTNAKGGKAALADWEVIALNGRDVIVAFDSDVMTKASVQGALERLAAFLRARRATARFALLPEEG
jgi:hypothetical protein